MSHKQSLCVILGLIQINHGFEILFRTFDPKINNSFFIKFIVHRVLILYRG